MGSRDNDARGEVTPLDYRTPSAQLPRELAKWSVPALIVAIITVCWDICIEGCQGFLVPVFKDSSREVWSTLIETAWIPCTIGILLAVSVIRQRNRNCILGWISLVVVSLTFLWGMFPRLWE
jgi:hypothetical protein